MHTHTHLWSTFNHTNMHTHTNMYIHLMPTVIYIYTYTSNSIYYHTKGL